MLLSFCFMSDNLQISEEITRLSNRIPNRGITLLFRLFGFRVQPYCLRVKGFKYKPP